MSSIQQALINVGLIKPQTFLGTSIDELELELDDLEQECPILGENHLGNKQYYLEGEKVCPRCYERYTNTLLGTECDICQQTPSY